MKTHYAIAFFSGIVVHVLINSLFGSNFITTALFGTPSLFSETWELDCLPFTLVTGVAYFNTGFLLGSLFPGISWKGGLFLTAPSLLIFLPLGILMIFAWGADWGDILDVLLNGDIYLITTQIIAAVLGTYLGSLFPMRKKKPKALLVMHKTWRRKP